MPVVPTLRPLKTLPTLEMERVSPSLSLIQASSILLSVSFRLLSRAPLLGCHLLATEIILQTISLSLSQKFCVSFFSAISDRCINIYIVSRFGESFFFWKIVDKGNI